MCKSPRNDKITSENKLSNIYRKTLLSHGISRAKSKVLDNVPPRLPPPQPPPNAKFINSVVRASLNVAAGQQIYNNSNARPAFVLFPLFSFILCLSVPKGRVLKRRKVQGRKFLQLFAHVFKEPKNLERFCLWIIALQCISVNALLRIPRGRREGTTQAHYLSHCHGFARANAKDQKNYEKMLVNLTGPSPKFVSDLL